MIHQISPVETKTGSLPTINRTLLQARHIQLRVKESAHKGKLPEEGVFWSPATSGPFIVPILHWLD